MRTCWYVASGPSLDHDPDTGHVAACSLDGECWRDTWGIVGGVASTGGRLRPCIDAAPCRRSFFLSHAGTLLVVLLSEQFTIHFLAFPGCPFNFYFETLNRNELKPPFTNPTKPST